jgi:hypothetical protein
MVLPTYLYLNNLCRVLTEDGTSCKKFDPNPNWKGTPDGIVGLQYGTLHEARSLLAVYKHVVFVVVSLCVCVLLLLLTLLRADHCQRWLSLDLQHALRIREPSLLRLPHGSLRAGPVRRF